MNASLNTPDNFHDSDGPEQFGPRILTDSTAVRSGFDTLSPVRKGASFGKLLSLLLIAVGGFALAQNVTSPASTPSPAVLAGLILGAVAWALFRINTLIYLFRAWSALQQGFVRTTPIMAVALLLIPFFNLYWMFVAYLGLAKDWNRVTETHPKLVRAPRLNTALALTTCLSWLLLTCSYWITSHVDLLGGAERTTLLLVLLVLHIVLELLFFKEICRGINIRRDLYLAEASHHDLH